MSSRCCRSSSVVVFLGAGLRTRAGLPAAMLYSGTFCVLSTPPHGRHISEAHLGHYAACSDSRACIRQP